MGKWIVKGKGECPGPTRGQQLMVSQCHSAALGSSAAVIQLIYQYYSIGMVRYEQEHDFLVSASSNITVNTSNNLTKTSVACAKRTRISCSWQPHTTCCITPNVVQTSNVNDECDKLATELSWQHFALKAANLQLPHLHLTYPTCI